MAAPGTWIGLVVVLMLLMAALTIVPLLGTLAQSVLMPVFAGGIALGCHSLAKDVRHRRGAVRRSGGRFLPLLIVGLIYLAAMVVLWVVVVVVLLGVAGGAGLFSALSGDPSQMGMALLGSLGLSALPSAVPLIAAPRSGWATGTRPRWSC